MQTDFDMELIPVEQFLHQLGGEIDVAFLACHTPGQQLATGEVISQAIVRSGTVIAQCHSTICTNYTHCGIKMYTRATLSYRQHNASCKDQKLHCYCNHSVLCIS